jgi:flagellar hook-associated protein 1
MSLEVTLRNAISGLGVTQKNNEIVSRNTSNVQTEGYTRKIHQQQQLDPRVGGVTSLDAIRVVDDALRRDLARQEGKVANYSARESALARIEAVNVDPEDELSLTSIFGRLREAFSELSSAPESPALQQAVTNRAVDVTDSLRRMSSVYEDERDRTETDIAASIEKINNLLENIANLNDSITTGTKAGRKVPDLEDQRDLAVKKLSEEMDVTAIARGDGSMAVLTSNGRTLVDRTAFTLSFTPSKTDNGTFYPGGGINGIMLGATDITTEIIGGRIGGYVQLRDETIPQYQAQLDEFAFRMSEAFSTSGLRLFVDGVGATPTAATRVGFSKVITIDATVQQNPTYVQRGWDGTVAPTVPPGDTTLIDGILRSVFDSNTISFANTGLGPNADITTGLPPAASLAQYSREIVAYQSNQRADLTNLLKGETTYRDSLSNRVADMSAVNLDQEVTLLIQLQQTYAANARVITTTNQMFDDLLGIVR